MVLKVLKKYDDIQNTLTLHAKNAEYQTIQESVLHHMHHSLSMARDLVEIKPSPQNMESLEVSKNFRDNPSSCLSYNVFSETIASLQGVFLVHFNSMCFTKILVYCTQELQENPVRQIPYMNTVIQHALDGIYVFTARYRNTVENATSIIEWHNIRQYASFLLLWLGKKGMIVDPLFRFLQVIDRNANPGVRDRSLTDHFGIFMAHVLKVFSIFHEKYEIDGDLPWEWQSVIVASDFVDALKDENSIFGTLLEFTPSELMTYTADAVS